MSPTESTYKDRDTEETIDIYFYRPIGFSLAHTARFLGLTPNAVTMLSGLVGIFGAHLLYYPSMRLTVAGILLLIFSDALDSADGQLARLTGTKSHFGRILDGLAGNLVFLSVYVNLCLRYLGQDNFNVILSLALAAAVCHSFQSALADYFRNGYLYFVRGPASGELDSSDEARAEYEALGWGGNIFRKLSMLLYRGHTNQQELMARRFTQLRSTSRSYFGDRVPSQFRREYGELSKPLIKYYNILTINTRMIALFIAALAKMPWLYFVFELTVMNAIFLYVIVRQERISGRLLRQMARGET